MTVVSAFQSDDVRGSLGVNYSIDFFNKRFGESLLYVAVNVAFSFPFFLVDN